MKRLLPLLALLSAPALADTVNLSWTPPTTREDLSALTAAEIQGYRISWSVRGTAQPDRTAPGGTNAAYVLDTGALTGRVCVVLRTVDVDGLESDPTAEVCRNSRPNRPTNVRIR